MQKGQNYNRPQKGSQIKVDPIRKKRDIASIKKLLAGNHILVEFYRINSNQHITNNTFTRYNIFFIPDP